VLQIIDDLPQITANRRNSPQFAAICRNPSLNCCNFAALKIFLSRESQIFRIHRNSPQFICGAEKFSKQRIANSPQFPAICCNLPHSPQFAAIHRNSPHFFAA